MKLILEHYNEKIEITTDNDDADIYEMKELFKKLLLGAGYHTNSIDEIFIPEEN